MNLEESQILLNVSTALANGIQVGIVSREEAKGILKQFLPKNEAQRNFAIDSAVRTPIKQKVSTTSDVK